MGFSGCVGWLPVKQQQSMSHHPTLQLYISLDLDIYFASSIQDLFPEWLFWQVGVGEAGGGGARQQQSTSVDGHHHHQHRPPHQHLAELAAQYFFPPQQNIALA